MATYISDDPKLLDELFRKDGEGQLLVGYETGKEKPHAESSYMLYPANPDRQDPVYTFMALFSQQSIKAKYSAFVPNTRLEIYWKRNRNRPGRLSKSWKARTWKGYCRRASWEAAIN